MVLPLPHIIKQMNDIHAMPDKLHRQLFEKIQRIEVPKNHLLLKPGQICNYYYYIEKGMLYSHKKLDNKDTGSWLMFPGNIATSVDSFNMQILSTETIRTVHPCVLHLLSWKDSEDFAQEHQAFSFIRHRLTNQYYYLMTEMNLQKNRPPEKFYEYLKQLYGENFPEIPHKILAAHMGISEALLYEIKKNNKR